MTKSVSVKIQGMHCKGCALGVEAALSKLSQVRAAKVSFADGSASVECDEALFNEATLREAVKAAGFEVTTVQ